MSSNQFSLIEHVGGRTIINQMSEEKFANHFFETLNELFLEKTSDRSLVVGILLNNSESIFNSGLLQSDKFRESFNGMVQKNAGHNLKVFWGEPFVISGDIEEEFQSLVEVRGAKRNVWEKLHKNYFDGNVKFESGKEFGKEGFVKHLPGVLFFKIIKSKKDSKVSLAPEVLFESFQIDRNEIENIEQYRDELFQYFENRLPTIDYTKNESLLLRENSGKVKKFIKGFAIRETMYIVVDQSVDGLRDFFTGFFDDFDPTNLF